MSFGCNAVHSPAETASCPIERWTGLWILSVG